MTGAGQAAGPATLLVTGAGGFLGRAIVAAALARGFAVRAVARDVSKLDDAPWRGAPGVERIEIDLGAPEARAQLDAALVDGIDAVIHAAAGAGDDAAHARDTVAATENLIAAMTACRRAPTLALISSLSVYNYASMPAGATLDETTPLEPEPARRDAYCRAKLAQEALAWEAAQIGGLRVCALRPGAIVGRGRARTARLGYAVGPLLIMPGGRAAIPAIAVDDCAALIVAAALAPPTRSDLPILDGAGWFEAINLVGRAQPDQASYAALIARTGWPRRVLRAPLRLARAPAQAVALAAMAIPALARRAPGPLRLESFDARFKPLRFSVARSEDRLGFGAERPLAEVAGEMAEDGDR